ncbi:MAG: hypothetical protein E7600_01685 [Ruminococcaceae bacterium]|nr:hypothetical protein [Oscillospiraceae bacterium]
MNSQNNKGSHKFKREDVVMAVVLAAFVVFMIVSICVSANSKKNSEKENAKPPVQSAQVIKKQPDAAKDNGDTAKQETPEIELNITPLGEVDDTALSASAQVLGFENKSFLHAFANALGKEVQEVTQQDIDNVHYIALGPCDGYDNSVFIGYIDYVDLCLSDAAYEPDFQETANGYLLKSEFVFNEGDSLNDLKKFKNIEIFEIYDTKIEDVSFVREYSKLCFGYFARNGITDVSALSDYSPESLLELDFTGNDISDWSPLEHIKEKVFVFYDIKTGISMTLESYLEQQDNPVQNAPEINNAQGNVDDKNEQPQFVDENGNPVDFSSLFE